MITLAISVLVYLPFTRRMDKEMQKEEAEQAA